MTWYWIDKWIFFNLKKLNLKKIKKKLKKSQNDTWHDTCVNIFKIKKILKKIKKIKKKSHKMAHGSYCLHSVNYFSGVSENDQI